VYAVGKTTTTHGLVRGLHAGSAFAILAVLYFPYRSLTRVQEWATHATVWGSLVQGVILPAATWLILLSMVCLCWAEWRERPTRPQLA
jgi:hypothetical protein